MMYDASCTCSLVVKASDSCTGGLRSESHLKRGKVKNGKMEFEFCCDSMKDLIQCKHVIYLFDDPRYVHQFSLQSDWSSVKYCNFSPEVLFS